MCVDAPRLSSTPRPPPTFPSQSHTHSLPPPFVYVNPTPPRSFPLSLFVVSCSVNSFFSLYFTSIYEPFLSHNTTQHNTSVKRKNELRRRGLQDRSMLLGKSPQAPVMRRTTSMSGGMAVDMPHDHGDSDDGIKDPHHHAVTPMGHDHGLMVTVPDHQTKNNVFGSKEYEEIHHEPLLGMVVASPSSHITTNNINHHSPNQTSNPPTPRAIQTPHFLRTCGLCKCHLAPGKDIYMYRGDTAFCSLECREQRIKEDSRKEKWKMKTSNKENHRASPPAAVAAATAKASTKNEAAACT